jgi:hypothetical protein
MAPKPGLSVFICGCGHTGTTLLTRILATHPDVYAVPYESRVFIDKVPAFGELAGLLRAAAASGKPVFLEKTPRHVLHVPRIRKLLPQSKFIIATRDGRDVVASLWKRHGDKRRAYKRYIKDSNASVDALSLPGTMLWRLEDLIEDPGRSLSEVCDFIGIPFTEQLLDYHKTPANWQGAANSGSSSNHSLRQEQISQPIRDTRGTWRSNLPPECLEWLSSPEARQIADAFGYSDNQTPNLPRVAS